METEKLFNDVRRAIKASGLGSNEVGRRAGIHKSAMSRFLNSERGLALVALERLVDALGLRIVLVRKGRAKPKRKGR